MIPTCRDGIQAPQYGVGRVYCAGGELNPPIWIARNLERRAPRGAANKRLFHAGRDLSYLVTAHERTSPWTLPNASRGGRIAQRFAMCRTSNRDSSAAWVPLRNTGWEGIAPRGPR